MPNWCSNSVNITFKTEILADKVYKELKAELDKAQNGDNEFITFAEYFCPMPRYVLKDVGIGSYEEINFPDNWYDWNMNNWGIKWAPEVHSVTKKGDSVIIDFESPWGPPIDLYKYIEDYKGVVSIDADWFEPGCDLLGTFCDGYTEDYIPSKDNLDEIPKRLVDNYNLEEYYQDEEE